MEIPGRRQDNRAVFEFEEDEEERLKKDEGNGIDQAEQKISLLWALLASYLPEDIKSIQTNFVRHVEYTLALTRTTLTPASSYQALALCVRDRLIERWKDTQIYFTQRGVKRVNYLSLEFLLGRSLQNAINSMNLKDNYHQALRLLGIKLEDLYDQESDAGLGNGGLGRLAACFLDSLATMDYPAWGYGLRYTYGMFYQKITDGFQSEFPDYWLTFGNPWEIERLDVKYPIQFYGELRETVDENGNKKYSWVGGETVLAVAYDYPIPGHNTYNTLNIRLWSSKPPKEFDLEFFNKGDYFKAIEDKQKCENITNVLYPNDNTSEGKELRLRQQYFFVSATLKDIIRRFKKKPRPFSEFPSANAIQLNDTHPALGIVELMRLLVDEEGLTWVEAWDITQRTFSYTNHTVLPEALEKWPVGMMQHLLPRHMKIIYDINLHFLGLVEKTWPGDIDRLRRMSIIEEGDHRMVRMAHLALVGSHTVNGVAEIHSDLLKSKVFPDFCELWPNKFQNKTNGVTPRRWIHQSNEGLSMIISKWLGTEAWQTNFDLIGNLKRFADDPMLQREWAVIKRQNKERLARYVYKSLGIKLNIDALFDVHVKRFHEYKRQLLNVLGVIYRYRWIKHLPAEEKKQVVKRVIFFAGKAAPGYYMAKSIIKLINNVADVVNNDKEIGDLLKVVFLPNYNVSLAEVIIPSSDISQHISTAGMEASGTSNMKFTMNGGLILGTLDGANIEIMQSVGEQNIFIFGAKAEQIEDLRKSMRENKLKTDIRFNEVLGMIQAGMFGEPKIFNHLVDSLTHGHDYYLLSYDFPSYLEAQERVDKAFKDKRGWTRMSIMCTAGTARFSSDRTIREYAEQIWGIVPCRRPGPVPISIERLSSSGLVDSDALAPHIASSPRTLSMERFSPSIGIIPPK
jgi:starch phosphorylase